MNAPTTTASQDPNIRRHAQTLVEMRAHRPDAFRESDRILAMRDEAAERQAARRFKVWVCKKGNIGGTWTEMISSRELIRHLTAQPLEKCLKREASHLLEVVEFFADREPKLLATFWVGSFRDITLTDWQKEYNRLAF